jgi:hypothetical protein
VLLLVVIVGVASRWQWLTFSDPFGAVVPFVVPWAGALGGVSISLVGVARYAHHKDWNPEQYAYWHLARPFLGCIFGTVAMLAVILLLQTVTVPVENTAYTPAGTAILAIISFVAGYREETFRSLVARVVDIILGPGGTQPELPIALVPYLIDLGETNVGENRTATFHVFNGSADTIHLTLKAMEAGPAKGLAIEPFMDKDIPPKGSELLRLNWTPTEAGELDTVLRLNIANVNLQARIEGNATT